MSFFSANASSILGIVGSVVGGIIGGYFGGYPGASAGIAIGGAIGGISGGYLFNEKIETNYAPPPKLGENRIQSSALGAALPYVAGTQRQAGNVIWMWPVVENYRVDNEHEGEVDYDIHTKTYTASFAVAFCMGPITGISRIWLNNEIFIDFRDPDGTYYPSSAGVSGVANWDASLGRQEAQYTIYLGSEDQAVDPTILALEGAAATPAFRGVCYVVFKDFNVGELAGLPNVEAEIVVSGSITSAHAIIDLDNINYGTDMLSSSHPWTLEGNYVLCDYQNHRFIIMNKFSEAVLSTFMVPAVATAGLSIYEISGWGICPWDGRLWVCCKGTAFHTYYRRNLIYTAPGVSVQYDSGDELVDVASAPYAAYGTNYFFERGFQVWERYITAYSGWIEYEGLRPLSSDSFYTSTSSNAGGIWQTGYRSYRIYKSDGTYIDTYGGNFSCDGTYFYLLAVSCDLGYGTTSHVLRINPLSVYTTSGSYPNWTMAIAYGGWTIMDYGADIDITKTPYEWSNGKTFPTTIYSHRLVQGPLAANNQQGLYTDPTNQTAYNRQYVTESGVPLSEVITDLVELSGLTSSDINVTALSSLSVLGYSVARQMPARTAIEPLMVGYNVDCCEEDWIIKFAVRGGTSAVDIATTDLGARLPGDPIADRLVQTEQQPIEIPTHLTLNYSSKNRDYERSAQHSFRIDKSLQVPMSIDIPLVFTDTYAKQLVEIAHQIIYQSRHRYTFKTGMKYIRLSPTDLATVGGKLMRITSVAYQLPILEFTAESEEGGAYTG